MSKILSAAVCLALALPAAQAAAQDQAADVPALKATEFEALKKLDGKQAKVTGKVVEFYKPESGNLIVLNFGKDSKTCFKVAIFKKDFANWDGGIAAMEKAYANKELTITGKVILYKDTPEIVVTLPKEIAVAKE